MGFMTTDEIAKMVKAYDIEQYSHVIICFDYNTHTFYPVYVTHDQDIYTIIEEIKKGRNNTDVREVYNYSMDINTQLSEQRSYHIESDEILYDEKKQHDLALEFAAEMHKGQCRKDGSPFINHPLRVANNVATYKQSNRILMLMQCAYLHDTLEDTKATYYDLLKYFGPQVAGIVLELTSEEDMKKELGKERYLSIRMKDMTSWALSIKLCDRLDNVSDLEYGGEEFKERYVSETLGILNSLIDNRKMSHSQLLIIKEILNIISNTQVHDKYKDIKVRDILLKTNIADSLITNPRKEKKLILY